MSTINEHLAGVQSEFRKLSQSRQSALKREARRYVASHPHMADSNGFWRGLSANQVLAA